MSEHMLHTNLRCALSEPMLHMTMWWNVRAYITYEYAFYPNLCYVHKFNMSEPMFLIKLWCLVPDLMLQTKMCNVWTYVTHEYEMCSVRTYGTYDKFVCPKECYTRKCDVFSPKMMLLTTMLYVICPIVCYTRKYEVLCPNLCYTWKYVMSELMLHTKIWCLVSELV